VSTPGRSACAPGPEAYCPDPTCHHEGDSAHVPPLIPHDPPGGRAAPGDAAALAKLPETERAAWQKLWADVSDLLERTKQPPAEAKPATPP
jgi:hypothetical protein